MGRPRSLAVAASESAVVRSLQPSRRVRQLVAVPITVASSRGGLWLAMSGALALRPGRARRAGVAGAAGWAAASGAAVALKQLTDRRRPFAKVPGPRVHTSSMPSSHAAGAFGYATAAAVQAPVLAAFAAPAMAVSWSRTATGRHFPTDVAAGAVCGMAVGAAAGYVIRRRGASDGELADDE
jgi:undecaprenyl-diphosphatase